MSEIDSRNCPECISIVDGDLWAAEIETAAATRVVSPEIVRKEIMDYYHSDGKCQGLANVV